MAVLGCGLEGRVLVELLPPGALPLAWAGRPLFTVPSGEPGAPGGVGRASAPGQAGAVLLPWAYGGAGGVLFPLGARQGGAGRGGAAPCVEGTSHHPPAPAQPGLRVGQDPAPLSPSRSLLRAYLRAQLLSRGARPPARAEAAGAPVRLFWAGGQGAAVGRCFQWRLGPQVGRTRSNTQSWSPCVAEGRAALEFWISAVSLFVFRQETPLLLEAFNHLLIIR